MHALPAAKPHVIEALYISEVRQLPDGLEWVYGAKLDRLSLPGGKDGKVTLWSRRGRFSPPRFRDVARPCEKLPPDTIVDGEVGAIDENGRHAGLPRP